MQNPPKLKDLRPDRALLNPNFEGYKLSLTPLIPVSEELKTPVDRLVPSTNQFSFLHAKLFILHNHLIGDEDSEAVFFIDQNNDVKKYFIDPLINQFIHKTVWQLPTRREKRPGDYNTSLLLTQKFAVVADGMGFLYVIERGSPNDDNWDVIFSGEIIGPDQNFIISDMVHGKPEIHLLVQSIRQEDDEKYSTILHWITISKSEDTWNQVALRELSVKGFVQYANFERSCKALYVVSDSGCKFTLDSENKIEGTPDQDPIRYTWTQSEDAITIKFNLTVDCTDKAKTRSNICVKTAHDHIRVKYIEDVLLEGPTHQLLDDDLTTWCLKDNVLEVVLRKIDSNMWNHIVKGDHGGQYLEAEPPEISELWSRAASAKEVEALTVTGTTLNSEQVEDCDFEGDSLNIFERICCKSHAVTDRVNLGSQQLLTTVMMDREAPLALGVRSDVDVCVWQPGDDEGFGLKHRGTLLALGYIQASKQQKKFCVASPDLSYSVICESFKHIFIYCQNKTVGNELKNRISGRRIKTLAQQQVVTLPTNDEILGIYISNYNLFILCENYITSFKL